MTALTLADDGGDSGPVAQVQAVIADAHGVDESVAAAAWECPRVVPLPAAYPIRCVCEGILH